MKFSYSLQFNTVPEWTADYLSYGQLKKAIHEVETARLEEAKGIHEANASADSTAVEMGPRSAQLEGDFFRLFQEDAEKVASAFNAKKVASNAKFEEFLNSISAQGSNSSSSAAAANTSDVSVNKIEVWTGDEDSLEKRRASLEDSFNSVYLNLHDLHDFLDLNYTGYVRVVKNYGKYLHATAEAKRELLNKIDYILPIAELSELQNKMGQVEEIYARVMCDGSITQARAALHLLLRDRVASLRQNVLVNSPVDSADIIKSAPIMSDSKTAAVTLPTPVAAAAPVKAAPYFTMYRIISLISITAVFFGILWAPKNTFGTLIVDSKQKGLAILISCVALWITEAIPLFITALLIPALFVALKAYDPHHFPTGKDAGDINNAADICKIFFGTFFSDMTFLLLGGFAIAAVFQKFGITRAAAVFVLKRFGKTPASTLMTIMVITVIASAFVSNVAAPVLCFSLIQPILKNLDYDHPLARSLILGIAFAANIGGLASPIASPQSVFGAKKLADFFSFGSWILMALPICIVSTVACWAWLLWTYPSKEVLNFKEIFATKAGEKKHSSGKIIYILAVFAITIVMWMFAKSLDPVLGPMGVTAVFPLVAYFGAGLLGKEDFNGFAWNVVILAIGGSALGKALDKSGLLDAIGSILSDMLSSFSYLMCMAIFCSVLLVITTFVSHSVGAFVFIPIIIQFAIAKGADGTARFSNVQAACLALSACFTCSAGMAMPISGFPNMTAASQQDRKGRSYVGTAEFSKGGIIPSIIFAASIVVVVALAGEALAVKAIFKN